MSIQTKQKLSSIWLRVAENIDNDYLEMMLITSRSGGLLPTQGRSFGVGKSTLGLWLTYRAHAYSQGVVKMYEDRIEEPDLSEQVRVMKDVILNWTVWSLNDLSTKVMEAKGTIPAILWDDVQADCPAWQHVPPKIREQIEYMTMMRQRIANIIMTAPSISDIARPLRENITWELIVPQRGTYEVQFIAKRRDFYSPKEDRTRLWYETQGGFPPLPEEVDVLYKTERDKHLGVILHNRYSKMYGMDDNYSGSDSDTMEESA
jgi:hypothetical protein